MKFTITKKVSEEVEIPLPYYYKHDLSSDGGDYIFYGKVEEGSTLIVLITKDYHGKEEYSLTRNYVHASAYACFMEGENDSNEAEFLAALEEVRKELGNLP